MTNKSEADKPITAADDGDFVDAVEAGLKAFGAEVKGLIATRRAKGIPDPVMNMSPDWQKSVIKRLEEEIVTATESCPPAAAWRKKS
jgi:hypothetical protein